MPVESTAPTVRTWGRLAGYSGGFPFWRLFPAAATTSVPAAWVTATIRSISGFLISEPRLRLTTPWPTWIAASRPRMTSPAVIPSPDGLASQK